MSSSSDDYSDEDSYILFKDREGFGSEWIFNAEFIKKRWHSRVDMLFIIIIWNP